MPSKPGGRPWAWWQWDAPSEAEQDRLIAEAKAAGKPLRCDAEWLLALGVCGEAERKAIIDQDTIADQIDKRRRDGEYAEAKRSNE